jgi:MazG family protein
MADRSETAGAKFQELVNLMARLRAPGGCPWDQKQTFDSIKSYLLEETYEVMDAIDARDWNGLEEELGDLLLQPVFFAEMAAGEGRFTIADSLDRINEKLIRRHPHIFADAQADTPEEVLQRWNEIKAQEKAVRGAVPSESILDGVPRNLPALVEAEKIGKKAAAEGFDWPNIDGALEKLKEEADELAAARAQAEVEHELGDLLFTVVNVARYLKVDPEQALRKANGRFRGRFSGVEQAVKETGLPMKETKLETLEEYWQAAKRQEKLQFESPAADS